MNPRERFNAVMNFLPFDRLPVMEWASWWNLTLEQWRLQGLPEKLHSSVQIQEYFNLDVHYQDWVSPRRRTCPRPRSEGAGMIASMDSYLQLRDHLYPRPAIDSHKWRRWATMQATGKVILWFTFEGFFWFPRTLLGIENHLYAFYDQPDLLHRINTDLADWMLDVIDELCLICQPDFMTFAEDLSYNKGPMLSAKLFEIFLAPYYRRVVPRLQEHGILRLVDSDGDISRAVPWFDKVDIHGLLPLERQAGVDIAALRSEHPHIRFLGCFNKLVMHCGEKAMRQEFERLLPVARRGGLVISCDHQTPPQVTLQDYQLYLKLFREYALAAGSC